MPNMDQIKQQLLLLFQQLQAEVEAAKEGAAPVALDQSSVGRLSRMDAMQQQQMILEGQRRRQQRLLRVQSALQRIEKGTYGACVRCSSQITEARIENEPEVTLCIDCAAG